MSFQKIGHVGILIMAGLLVLSDACQKTGSIPATPKPASLTVLDAIPGSNSVIPIIGAGSYDIYFSFADQFGYGNFTKYSPPGVEDTAFVVQVDDTVNVGPKSGNTLFYGILNLQEGGIYSLYLTGSDTNHPDYLMTTDSIPSYVSGDSVMGIRFVNLSTGSNPFSINLEGGFNGSEVTSLPYKGITNFKPYSNISTTQDYLFVVRDLSTGDSLTRFDFHKSGFRNNGGLGLMDPYTDRLLTFENVTIAILGSETNGSPFPLRTILIENY